MSLQAIVNDGNVVFNPKSNGIVSSQSALLHRNIKDEPRTVTFARGNYLTLDNGQRIFDATGGAAVACLGHGNKRVKRAVAAQMDEVAYCHSLFFGSRSGEGLARHLIDSTKGRMSKAFIVSSGIRNHDHGVFQGFAPAFHPANTSSQARKRWKQPSSYAANTSSSSPQLSHNVPASLLARNPTTAPPWALYPCQATLAGGNFSSRSSFPPITSRTCPPAIPTVA